MEFKTKLPITEIYRDIYCNDNGNCWVCRVFFTLVESENLNLKPGDPIRITWFDINANREQPKSSHLGWTQSSYIVIED
jgi:hypothetical protein